MLYSGKFGGSLQNPDKKVRITNIEGENTLLPLFLAMPIDVGSLNLSPSVIGYIIFIAWLGHCRIPSIFL